MVNPLRLSILILAMTGLVTGLVTGLSRIGWNLNILETSLHHGSIMVGGFLGTLVSLEKIIPLKRKFLFIIPGMSGMSVLTFALGAPAISFSFLVMASIGLSAVFAHYLVREREQVYALMFLGSLCWLTGNLLLITRNFYPLAFPWWLGFVLFVITAERLAIMKFLPVSNRSKSLLILFLCIYIAGIMLPFHAGGNLVSGLALVFVSVWLLQNDILRISPGKAGLPKFIAFALASGYVALLMTGIFLVALNGQALAYDAIVHTFFLGFVFSMIFAHGPIILPGVLGMAAKPYHSVLYLWLALLHASWITRMASDALLQLGLRKFTGIASVLCILAYFGTIATLTVKARRQHAKIL